MKSNLTAHGVVKRISGNDMTYDELLAKISHHDEYYSGELMDALRAVVELTRKYEDFDGVDSAGMSGYRLAMKAVIQAIEKELK